jgi:3-oxoacyl-[acyl-carrier-protein] synthase III
VIACTSGSPVAITGLGSYVPDRVLTNAELSAYVDTSDAWIRDRTGIRERRVAAAEEATSDLALRAARQALDQAGVTACELALVIVATVTPDMAFPATAALLADQLGAPAAAAFDLFAGCTGFVYALAQARAALAAGLARRALVVGGDELSRILDWSDRSTLILFGDGAGAVVVERVQAGSFLGFELGADGSGGSALLLPGSGSRTFASTRRFLEMNGREVFKFAARAMGARPKPCSWPAGRRSMRLICTFPTRPTSASSSRLCAGSGSRERGWSSTSSATGTPHRARSRSPWAMQPSTAVFNLENLY